MLQEHRVRSNYSRKPYSNLFGGVSDVSLLDNYMIITLYTDSYHSNITLKDHLLFFVSG